MSVRKSNRWRVLFNFLCGAIFTLSLCLWSPSFATFERLKFISGVRKEIHEGLTHLFKDGYETLQIYTDFVGESLHGKRKQLIQDAQGVKHTLFIKIFYEKTPLADRKRLVEITSAMTGIWNHPHIFWHDPHYTLMITEFLEGKHPDQDYFKDPEALKTFVEKLKESHTLLLTLPIDIPRDSLCVRAQKRLQELLKVAPELQDRLIKAEGFLNNWTPSFDAVVHGDIQSSNIVLAKGIHLIDWSEVSYGDIFEDLGSLAEQMHFAGDQEVQMLKVYFGRVVPEDLEKLKKHRLLTRLHFGCYFLREGFKKLKAKKAKLHPGQCGLALEPQIQQGMALLKPFLD